MCQRGNCPFSNIPKDTEEIETEMAENYRNGRKFQPWDQANRRQKLGEIERKLAKLSMPAFTYRSSS
jgi:hypothetical protein